MRHYANIEKMCGLLRVINKELPGSPGSEEFKRLVVEQLEFTPQQADVYVSTVMSRNLEDSADNVKTNADALYGTWTYMEQTGNPLGYMKTVTESWHFHDDLKYEHKLESYAAVATTGPFLQSSYSSPRVDVDNGFWAPADAVQPGGVDVAVISFTKAPQRLNCRWAGPDGRLQTKFSIYGRVFIWE